MVQPSILPGNPAAAAPPTLTAFGFGMNFMPAFLDSKANSLPATITREYYGLDPLPEDKFVDEPQPTTNNNQEEATSHRFETQEEC